MEHPHPRWCYFRELVYFRNQNEPDQPGDQRQHVLFRDHLGNEIDLIVERENGPKAIEIKSSKKQDRKLLAGLKYWNKYQPSSNGILLFQGEDGETDNPLLNYLAWENIDQL